MDNGAGTVVVLEAARILKQLGVRPKRTIRFALWSGEEQGLLGSLAYVRQHLVSRAGEDAIKPTELSRWSDLWPITPKPGYGQLKAYFNLDNGSGKIRGIHTEGDAGADSLLKKWLAPFDAMGAASLVASPTGGSAVITRSAGKVTSTSVPSRSFERSVKLPPWRSIRPLTIGKPRPAPCSALFSAFEP